MSPLDAISERLSRVPWAALIPHRESVLEGLRSVLGGAPAARELERVLKRRAPLEAEARQAIAEALFGVGLWRRALAHHAGLDLERPGPEHAAVLLGCLLRDLARAPGPLAFEAAGGSSLPPSRPPSERPAVRTSVPDWLWDVLRDGRDDAEAEAFAWALNVPGPVFLRVNAPRITRETLAPRLLAEDAIETRPTRSAPHGLEVVSPRPNILGSRAHQEGLFEVQDEGSQLLGLALGAQPGHHVLDACAGAGGKTLLLAAALQGQGELHAYDPDGERLSRLERRAQTARTMPIAVHRAWPPASLRFDRVLVDAPCSELGALRRGPDVRWRLDPSTFTALPVLQLDILRRAALHLRTGGRLLYATCTLRRAENEEVVARFLEEHADFALASPFAPELRHSLPTDLLRGDFLTLEPHRHRTDGFFAAALERRGRAG